MKRRGPGRPALPKAERKGKILSIRMSHEDYAQVERSARAMGLTPAAWARMLMLHETIPPPIAPVAE